MRTALGMDDTECKCGETFRNKRSYDTHKKKCHLQISPQTDQHSSPPLPVDPVIKSKSSVSVFSAATQGSAYGEFVADTWICDDEECGERNAMYYSTCGACNAEKTEIDTQTSFSWSLPAKRLESSDAINLLLVAPERGSEKASDNNNSNNKESTEPKTPAEGFQPLGHTESNDQEGVPMSPNDSVEVRALFKFELRTIIYRF